MVSFDGRTVIVTGGGRGIGRAACELFGDLGANVVVNGIGGDKQGAGSEKRVADEVVAAVEDAGGTATADYNDVGTMDGADSLVESAIDEFGRLDAVYNNAGILRENSLVSMTEAEWDEVIRVHLKGMFAVSQRAGQHWREQHKAGVERPRAIVNASSDVAAGVFSEQGSSYGLGNYAAAKAGILGLTRNAAEEFSEPTKDELVELWQNYRNGTYYQQERATTEQAEAMLAYAECMHEHAPKLAGRAHDCIC